MSTFTQQPPESIAKFIPVSADLHFPGYDTKVIHARIDNRDVIIQLWKGYCPSYLPGLVGGFGGEVALYYKKQFWPASSWWPDFNHKEKISFKLLYPNSDTVFFQAAETTCWWRHKWMVEASYLQYKTTHPNAPNDPTDYRLSYKIIGNTNTIQGIW